jgi:CRISPR-associated protein Cmr1
MTSPPADRPVRDPRASLRKPATTWAEVHLRVATPAFVGGATSRAVDPYQPLRPASVRGALRAWFRFGVAAQLHVGAEDAGAPGHRDRRSLSEAAMDVLRELELDVFGGVFGAHDGDNRGAQASRLVVPPISPLPPTKEVPKPPQGSGLRYLGYGIFDQEWLPEAVMPAGAADPALCLRLGVHRQPGDDDAAHERLLGALAATVYLWTTLGGLGSRVRRGWGTLKLCDLKGLPWPTELKGVAPPPIGGTPRGAAEALDRMMQGFDTATVLFRRYVDAHPAYRGSGERPRPSAPAEALAQDRLADKRAPRRPHTLLRTLAGVEAVRLVPGDHPSASAAMERAGSVFQNFRSTLRRNDRSVAPLGDYFAVKAAIQGGEAPPAVGRAAFGLPLPFYFRSLNGAKATVSLPRVLGVASDRMPSALVFRPVEVGPGRWTVALIYLAERVAPGAARHLSAGQPLQVKVHRGPTLSTPGPDDRLIHEFFRYVAAGAPAGPGGRP